jgi:hypothetical protein
MDARFRLISRSTINEEENVHSAFPKDKKLKPGIIAGWRGLKTLCKKWMGRSLSNSRVMYYVTLIVSP